VLTTAYDLEKGQLLWTYKPEGTHAYAIAPSSDNTSVWLAEQPYQEPPWHRLRLLSSAGEIKQEVRCALGHSFAIAPYHDSVIRGNLVVTPIGELECERAKSGTLAIEGSEWSRMFQTTPICQWPSV